MIGGGVAGLRAAIEASTSPKLKVTVAAKSIIPGGSSVMAGASYASAGYSPLSGTTEDHFTDTIRYGEYINNQRLVRVVVDEAHDAILDLERLGGMWPRSNKASNISVEEVTYWGHSYPRGVHNWRSWQVPRALYYEARRRKVHFRHEFMITRLLKSGKAIVGAAGIDIKTGDFLVFSTKATILASGGCSKLYKYGNCDKSLTGDGYALALKAGAEMANMEFIDWGPLSYVRTSLRGRGFGGTAGMMLSEFRPRTDIPPKLKLLNRLGERFMRKYEPFRLEYAQKDIVTRAVYNEIRRGRGTENGAVWFDPTEMPKDEIEKWLDIHGPGRPSAMKIAYGEKAAKWQEPVEGAPTVYTQAGGVRINEHGETNIEGLYAVGEVSSGMHGADRLTGNNMIECLVMGKHAGKRAAEYALSKTRSPIPWNTVEIESARVFHSFGRRGRKSPFEIKARIQDLMYSKVGPIRNGKGLAEALEGLEEMRKEVHLVCVSDYRRCNYEWITALELENMLDCSEMIIRSALFRTESRGSHYREDYPKRNDSWAVETGIRLLDENIANYRILVNFVYAELGEFGFVEREKGSANIYT